jgi:hypothetical protein
LISTALAQIPVGVLVERHEASSPWVDFLYRPVAVLTGVPAAEAWTLVRSEGDTTTLYAGRAVIELHRTETANYRDNLASGVPLLWVVLRPAAGNVGFSLLCVTADPAEGEALTGAGNDVIETVPMPAPIREIVASFVAEHHVERPFVKRQRDRSAPQPSARRSRSSEEEA